MVRPEVEIAEGEIDVVRGRMKMEWIMRTTACRQCTKAASRYNTPSREGH